MPARSMLQNFKGTNGKTSCPICYHPGYAVKNVKNGTTIRYTKCDKPPAERTHNETVQRAKCIDSNTTGTNSIDGIKGLSCMLLYDHFNIIDDFAIDFMHGILLGITKDVAEIWLGIRRIPDPKNNLKIKLKNADERKCFNNRIVQLKPLVLFRRKPRSIFDIPNYKASELMHFLLYYFRSEWLIGNKNHQAF